MTYIIRVVSNVGEYEIERKYSHFVHLNMQLRKQFRGITLRLPSRYNLWLTDRAKFHSGRQDALNEFIRHLSDHQRIRESDVVKRFFAAEQPDTLHDDDDTYEELLPGIDDGHAILSENPDQANTNAIIGNVFVTLKDLENTVESLVEDLKESAGIDYENQQTNLLTSLKKILEETTTKTNAIEDEMVATNYNLYVYGDGANIQVGDQNRITSTSTQRSNEDNESLPDHSNSVSDMTHSMISVQSTERASKESLAKTKSQTSIADGIEENITEIDIAKSPVMEEGDDERETDDKDDSSVFAPIIDVELTSNENDLAPITDSAETNEREEMIPLEVLGDEEQPDDNGNIITKQTERKNKHKKKGKNQQRKNKKFKYWCFF